MEIYEVILTDGCIYEAYETVVGVFDSKDKAEKAKAYIDELINKYEESHIVYITKIGILNELDKETLEHWNLYNGEELD